MVSNAHAGAENGHPEVKAVLDQHHQQLRDALHAALITAEAHGRRAPGAGLLAYGVNLRSRSGARTPALQGTVAAALDAIGGRTAA
ncbi:hypothetical protein [Streptomyces violascens]|uniref:Uncharacterized protein n=1 Tax=Streptomyces violascens TaxID=67381 RepID=A0ABQ3QXR8_9ACTN|nr:hypothetical protein [Streptomyces violascens]GGU18056.1 hypothetical protein GCM10010289_44630 [Streptomyces violascens]GHI42055.1 hypothetical protein Sviol_64630 [Streptomyces violascens]